MESIEGDQQSLEILKSLSEIFYSLHLIDLRDDTVAVYNARNEVKAMVTKSTGITKTMKEVISSVVSEAYKNDALFFSDLTTVADRMKNKKIISAQFVGNRVGWFEASFVSVESGKDGKPVRVIFSTRVIEKEKKKEEKLLLESNTDQLTGFYNRRAYEDAIKESKHNGWDKTAVYVSIDINGLKVVNDNIGHEAGDELILGAANCLRKCLMPYGKIFRTGGDEFIALLNIEKEKLDGIKNDLSETCAKWKGKLVSELSLSCGYVCAYEDPNMSFHGVSVLADKRMYEAKNNYYRNKGIDRRGQRDAHTALCALYSKILKINVSEDSYQIISSDESRENNENDQSEKISEWLESFGKNGGVHPEDLDEYLKKTKLEYLRNYFRENANPLRVMYRRKSNDMYKTVLLEMIPANDYDKNNQNLFLYVKEIN